MFTTLDKKKIIISILVAVLAFVIIATSAIIGGLNIMLHTALYASEEVKQRKADNYTAIADTTPHGGIVFAGDSIIEMYNLDKHFPDRGYINRGISGDQSHGLLNRLQTNIIDIAPSKIFIMIGINDMGYDVPKDEYLTNYTTILDTIQESLPDTQLYMFKLFPLRYESSITSLIAVHSRTHALVKEWNEDIADLAHQRNVELIDLYDVLSDHNGRLHKMYTREGLHISERGYTKISSMLEKYLV